MSLNTSAGYSPAIRPTWNPQTTGLYRGTQVFHGSILRFYVSLWGVSMQKRISRYLRSFVCPVVLPFFPWSLSASCVTPGPAAHHQCSACCRFPDQENSGHFSGCPPQHSMYGYGWYSYHWGGFGGQWGGIHGVSGPGRLEEDPPPDFPCIQAIRAVRRGATKAAATRWSTQCCASIYVHLDPVLCHKNY